MGPPPWAAAGVSKTHGKRMISDARVKVKCSGWLGAAKRHDETDN